MTFQEYVEETHRVLDKLPHDQIGEAVQTIDRARTAGKWVFLFGNGGSAANASHWTNGLQSVGVKAHALDNVPVITAIANDAFYDLIFLNQLADILESGDVVVGLSCRGNSPNVLAGIEYTRERGATSIGLTAFDGGKLTKAANVPIHVPVDSYEIGEDVHSMVGHMIVLKLKELY